MTHDGRQPEESGFLARWSREKAKTRDVSRTNREESTAVPVVKPDAGAVISDDESRERANDAPKRAATTPELPPIESLTKDSDFTGFLADGVSDDLRRQALRRLWNVDPLFGTQCNLDIFIDDYTKIIPIDIAKDTIYKVGLGFCEPEDFMTEEEKEAHRKAKALAAGENPQRAEAETQERDGAIHAGETANEPFDSPADTDSGDPAAGSIELHDSAGNDAVADRSEAPNSEPIPILRRTQT